MNANNRGLTIFTALLSGFFIGALLSALLLYAFLPAQRLVGQIGPAFLTRANAADNPGYREFYIAGIANRYKDRVNKGAPADAALNDARNQLGVVSGDATPQEAAQMVRIAFEVAQNENTKNADEGWFTIADQNNLNDLATQLENTQNLPAVTSQYDSQRNTLRLLGLVVLALLLGLAGLAIYWAFGFDGRKTQTVSSSAPRTGGFGSMAQQALRNSPFGRATQPQQPAQNVGAMQQPASVAAQSILTDIDPNATGHIQMPDAFGETLLATFAPTLYQHGDDRYEEAFDITDANNNNRGMCGVNIVERLELAKPSKVCALGVWVLAKADQPFKSIAKVLMTPNAHNDPIIRNKLSNLGDAVLAQNGMFEISTATMRLEVTVSDLMVNPAGYFDKVTLTFAVYRKGAP